MTVIAYDGLTVAADKQASDHDFMTTVTKLRRHGDEVLAFVGNADAGLAMMAWYMSERDPASFPNKGLSDDSTAWLYVFRRGANVQCYQRMPVPIIFEDPIFACGSGRAAAMAALVAGVDARRAIEITCQVLEGCGRGIDVMELSDATIAAAA